MHNQELNRPQGRSKQKPARACRNQARHGFRFGRFRPMSQVTSRCDRSKAYRRLHQPRSFSSSENALDELNDLWGELASLDHEWFRPMEVPYGPQRLDDSFSDVQTYRRPTPREANSLRFEIQLWASVDVRRPVCAQVADSLRRMARFLAEQAAKAEQANAAHLENGGAA